MAVSSKGSWIDSRSAEKDYPNPWLYLSRPYEFDIARVKELYGGDSGAETKLREKSTVILNILQVHINGMICLRTLLPHLLHRELLTGIEKDHLTNYLVPPDSKLLSLSTYIHNKGKTGLARFYLCLMDTWGLQGVEQHYDLAIKLRKQSFNAEDVYEQEIDVENIIERMPPKPMSPELMINLMQAIGVVPRLREEIVPDLSVLCRMWRRQHHTSLNKLVEVLLCTPGAGHLVTGLVPICRSNPPILWQFIRKKIGKNWEKLAVYLGFSSPLIESIKSVDRYTLRRQLERFMTVWRVPDCGDRMQEVLFNMNEQLEKYIQPRGAGLDATSEYASLPVEQSQDGGEVSEVMLDQFSRQLQSSGSAAADGQAVMAGHTQSNPPLSTSTRKVSFATDVQKYGRRPPTDVSAPEMSESEGGGYKSDGESGKEEDWTNQQSAQPQSSEPSQESGSDLVSACQTSDWECAKVLIESGSELEGRNQDGQTPLLICCMKGNIEMVQYLISRYVNLQAVDNSGRCCLHLDEVIKNLSLLKLLVGCYQDYNYTVEKYAKNWYSPLLVACLAGERCNNAVEVLLAAGADCNGHNRAAHRPLTVASAAGDTGIFHTLIRNGARIDIQDRNGCTPLLCACLRYHHQLANYLIDNGAPLNLSDKHGTTPLFACVESGAIDLARKLLEHGAPINIIRNVTKRFMAGSVEETPLAHACGRGDLEMAKLLVAHGADINRLCAGTVPPVGFAIICWQFAMVEYMIGLPKFDSSTQGLSRPLIIGIKCENWIATHLIIVKFFSTLDTALQRANEGGFSQLESQLMLFMQKTSSRNLHTLLQEEIEFAKLKKEEGRRTESDSHYTIEQNLQRFSQICVSALKAKTDLTEVATVALADGHHHISDFFRECHSNTQSPQQLKTNFLYGQPSPLRFSLENSLLTMEDFVHHTELFFPGRSHEFCEQLVLTFHEMNGGSDLPTGVDECLNRLFSGQFCPGVSVGTRVPQQLSYPGGQQGSQALPAPDGWQTGSSGFDRFQSSVSGQAYSRTRHSRSTTSSRAHTSSSAKPTKPAFSDDEKDGRQGTPAVTKVVKQDTQHKVTSAPTSDHVLLPTSTYVTLSTKTQVTPSTSTSAPISTPQVVPSPQVASTTPSNYVSNDLGLDDQQLSVPATPQHSPSTLATPHNPHPASPRSAHRTPQPSPSTNSPSSARAYPPSTHPLTTQSVSSLTLAQSSPFSSAEQPGNPRHKSFSQHPSHGMVYGTQPRMESDSGLQMTTDRTPPSHSYDHLDQTPSYHRQNGIGEEEDGDSEEENSDTDDQYRQSFQHSNPPDRRTRLFNSVPSHRTKTLAHSQLSTEQVTNSLKLERIVWTRDCEKLFKNLAEILSGQWRSLGEVMQVPHDKLDALAVLSGGDDVDATVEMLRYWVKKHWQPTWHLLEDCIKELPMINHALIGRKINRYLHSHTVTKVEIVTQDRRWVEQITQEATDRAIEYQCSYGLWTGNRLKQRSIGLPLSWH